MYLYAVSHVIGDVSKPDNRYLLWPVEVIHLFGVLFFDIGDGVEKAFARFNSLLES